MAIKVFIALVFSSAVGPVLHKLLLPKLSSTGFPDGYISWFLSFLNKRQSRIRISATLSLPSELIPVCPRALSSAFTL
jgi:hypothetical protein